MADIKSAKPPNAAIEQMVSARNELVERLQENPDYRALVALERAIAELTGAPIVSSVTNGSVHPAPPIRRESAPAEIGNMTQPDAAEVLLTKVLCEPTGTATLVKALGAHGIVVGGDRPNINLSSVLSKDGRFRSVQYKDRKGWWVKNRPFPGELDTP